MDISGMSDDELRAIAARSSSTPSPPPPSGGSDLSKMTDDELRALASRPDKERTLGGALGEAAGNLLPSIGKNIGQLAEGVGSMVMHPINTAETMGKLAFSISPLMPALKAAASLTGSEKMAEFLKDMDAPKQALIEDYAKAYGGWQPFLKTLSEDPARVMTDLATVATGGEAALAKLPGVLGKAGKVAGVLKNIDPVQLAAKGVEVAAPKIGSTVAGLSNMMTGTGAGAMQEAFKSGYVGGQMGQDLRGAMRGQIPMSDVVARAKQGIQDIEDTGVAEYLKNKDVWKKDTTGLNFNRIDKARTDLMDSLTTESGAHLKVSQADADRIGKLDDIIGEWKNDPRLHNPLGFDDLKQRIRAETKFEGASPQVRRAGTTLSNAVQDTIFDAVGKNSPYAKSMEALSSAKGFVNDIEKAFSLGDKASAQTSMTKLQSLMRKNVNTSWGHREEMADLLNNLSGVNLRPLVAGQALSHWMPHGIMKHVLGGSLVFHPAGWAAAAAHLPMASPRLAGEMYHGLGQAAGLPGNLYNRLPPQLRDLLSTTGQAATSQPARNLYEGLDRTGGFARGGRVGFDIGGSTSDFSNGDFDMPMPAVRGAVNASLPQVPKVVDPISTILSRQVGPSQLVQPVSPAQAPRAPTPEPMKTDTSFTDTIQKAADQWNKGVKKSDDDETEKKLKDVRDQIAKGVAGATTTPATTPAGGDTSSPDAVPLKGDTYEDKVALRESGGKPFAINNSGAAGLYQFMPATAEGIRVQHPELGISDKWRFNVDDQKKLMKAFTDANRDTLRSTLKRDPTGGELYLAHFLGAGGAQRFLGGLDKPIEQITTEAERAGNPFVSKFKTGQDMLNYFNKLFG